MNDLQLFNYDGQQIRTTIIDGEPWIVSKDVCEAMGYSWQPNLVMHVPEEWRGLNPINTPSGTQVMHTLSEAGLNFFVGRSDKPSALPFQKWIAGNLLPTIRKTGGYVTDAGKFVDSYFQGLPPAARLMLVTALDEGKRLNEQLAIATPKAEGYDVLMSSGDCISIGEMAKLLKTGQNRLFRFLRGVHILMSDNLPYQRHIDEGHFKVIEQTWKFDGQNHIGFKTLVTPKGQEYIRKIWEPLQIGETDARNRA
jgi:anti-repressor protein